ncbi:MAG: ATP-binding protein [Thermoflexibacteraceae bacterium]
MMNRTIQVPCEKNNLRQIRSFVAERLQDFAVEPADADMLVLAIDEVCANVMEHEQAWNPNANLELSIWVENGRLVFEVQDYAPDCFFDPANYKCPNIHQIVHEKRNGGMGLIIVQSVMDAISTEKRGCYNVYKFYKNI